jgi:Na+-transporting methylmalonyl-CoA/oxaloacetate decarboxylase gamma subunit
VIQELIQNNDSLNAVTKTAIDTTTVVSDSLFNQITFDPSRIIESGGLLISIVGYTVVFAALVLLYYFFANVARLMNYKVKKQLKAKGESDKLEGKDSTIPGEVAAAISMAVHLHFAEVHDFENTVLTIKKVQRPYSPWSSKLYGLREYPKK